jgi:PAS domain S-box-containing protein
VITRNILLQTYLFMLGCGLVVLGLFAGVDFLSQSDPTLASVKLLPDSALLAMLVGSMFLGRLGRTARLHVLPALGVVALCVYSLLHSWLAGGDGEGTSLVTGFLRMRDGLATVMLLSALALLLRGRPGRIVSRFVAGILLLVCLLQVLMMLGVTAGTLLIGFKFSTNLMAALMAAMIGLGVLAHSFLPRDTSLSLSRIGMVLGLASALAAGVTWYLSSQNNFRHLQVSSGLLLDAAEQHLYRSLEARTRLLQRIGERWEIRNELPEGDVWLEESASYLRDHRDLQFIAVLDQRLRPVLISKQTEPSAPTLGRLLANVEPGRLWHQHRGSLEHDRAFLGGTVDEHGLFAMPLRLAGRPLVLTAGVDLRGLLDGALATQASHFALRIERAGQEILGLAGTDSYLLMDERAVALAHGEQWRLQTLINRTSSSGVSDGLATSEFVFLLLVGMLLMLTQRMTSLAMHRTHLLRRLTGTLRSNMQRQAELHAFNEQMMRHSLDLLCVLDEHGRFMRVSQSAASILGYQPEEMQSRPVTEFIVSEDDARTAKMISRMDQVGILHDSRNRFWHRDGHQVDMMWSAAWDAESRSLFCVGRDISEFVVRERFAQDQKDVLSMISGLQPLTQILDAVCAMVERRLPDCRASVSMVCQDTATLAVLSAPSLPEEYRIIVNGIAVAEGSCACATAACRGETIRVDDVAKSELWADYREAALDAGLRSCWCMPMMSQNDAVLGTLSLYSTQVGLPDLDPQVMLVCTQLAALALEREQDRSQLMASEQRYRSLFSQNPDTVFSVDRNGVFTSMNEAGFALMGMNSEQLLGSHFSALVEPGELSTALKYLERSLAGEPLRYETRLRSYSGVSLELDVSTLPVVVDGEVVGVFGVAKDLFAIKAARRDMERQLAFTQAVTNSLQEGLIAIDANGIVGFINPAAEALLGMQSGGKSVLLSDWVPLNPVRWQGKPDQGIAGEFEQKEEQITRHIAYRAVPLRGKEDGGGWVITLRDRTAELKAGQALAERNQFFSLSLDMFCMISLKGLFVQLNPAMLNALGYLPGELVNQPYIDILVPADRSKAESAMNGLARAESVANLDLRVRKASGAIMTLELNAALGDDRVVYVVARDVTEQRAMDKLFEQHRAMFEIAGSIARIGGWIIDLQTNKVTLSDEVCAIHKLPVGSTIDMDRVVDLYAPEYHRVLRAGLKKCIKQGVPYELRGEALDSSGERIWVRVMGKALRGSDGQITHIQGALQDISDSVQAENDLQRLATQLRNTLDSITDAFYSVDADWRFTYINSRAEVVLERSAEELIGEKLWMMFPEARSSDIHARYHQAVASGQSQHFETYYHSLQRWFEISAYPYENGLSIFFRDISERKQGEERLRATLDELERSNRELQDFAFIASHDLQEPLRKVQAFGERLEKRSDQLDETGRDYLQRMRQASGRMQRLIQDLLSYSRVTSRGGELKPVSLDRILDGVLFDLEATIEIAGGLIERQPLTDLLGDARQLGQLLQNLISNALKFHQEDQSPVIRIYGESEADGRWTLCVADNGIGFDEKYLDRIFNPFQRLHERQQFSGTGIGLAIVRKIAERHQAEVTARSEPGSGSIFRVSFMPNVMRGGSDPGSTDTEVL